MPYDETLLDEYADVIFQRLEDFNDYTLEVIGRHIKEIGSLSAYDQQALKNMADISGDMKKITEKLAEITKMNIEDIEKIYTQVISDGLKTYKPLYDFKGMKFIPFQNNEVAKRIVRQFAMITDGEMVNLTRTKALGFDRLGVIGGKVGVVGSYSLSEGLERVLGEAVTAVSAGTTDFNAAMRKTIGEIGGSGVKVVYGSGVNRSVSAAVRQNVLWGVKKSIDLYDDELSKELDFDGFEVDAHSGCRPSHEFMQGQMYAIGKGKTVNGKYYPSGDEALKALTDYGCLHYKTGVLLGISPSRYTKEELKKIRNETKEIIEFDGKKHTLYEWKQVQRRMERQTRNEMSVSKLYKVSGDNIAAKQHKERAMAYLNKYDGLVKGVPGLEDRRDRMRVFEGSISSHKGKTIDKITSDFAAKKLTNGGKGGIISSIKANSEVQDVHYIGKIDKNIYKCVTKDIQTDEVIITNVQIQHIKERHPNDYERYFKYAEEIIKYPDYIIEANKPYTALILKEIKNENESFKTVLRLAASVDNPEYKNSIITFMKIDEKEWKRVIKNKKILYKSE